MSHRVLKPALSIILVAGTALVMGIVSAATGDSTATFVSGLACAAVGRGLNRLGSATREDMIRFSRLGWPGFVPVAMSVLAAAVVIAAAFLARTAPKIEGTDFEDGLPTIGIVVGVLALLETMDQVAYRQQHRRAAPA